MAILGIKIGQLKMYTFNEWTPTPRFMETILTSIYINSFSMYRILDEQMLALAWTLYL